MPRPPRKDIRSLDGFWTERFSAAHSAESERSRETARSLRSRMTVPERILWSRLRRNALGVRFRRQHPVGPFTADFYCHEAWLVVEVDGRSTHDYREREDRARDAYLRSRGLEIRRYSASEVTKDVTGVVESIRVAVAQRLSAPATAPVIEEAR